MSLSLAVPSRIAAGLGWPRSVRWTRSLGWPGDLVVPRETVSEHRSADVDSDPDLSVVDEVTDADGAVSLAPSRPVSVEPRDASVDLTACESSVSTATNVPGVGQSDESFPHRDMDSLDERGSAQEHPSPVHAEAPAGVGVPAAPRHTAVDERQKEHPPAAAAAVPRETASDFHAPEVPGVRPADSPEASASSVEPDDSREIDVSRETPSVSDPMESPTRAPMNRPPGPRRAKFDRDEFDTGDVPEPPAPARPTAPTTTAAPPTLPKPHATRVFVVANQKGGVGKTTTSVNLAAGLALGGLNVLVLDLDPQGNASTALGIDHSPGVPGTYEVLIEGSPIADHLVASPEAPNLQVLPATIDLAGAEIQLVSMVARENRLRKALRAYLADHPVDYVFLDCPPSLGLITLNALVAASEILIPIQCEYYALEGVSQLVRTINLVKGELNEDLAVSTVLLTMFDARTRLAAQVADEVRAYFTEETLPTVIPRSVRISEAPSYGQTVLTYHPDSAGAVSYLQAAHEIARRGARDEQ